MVYQSTLKNCVDIYITCNRSQVANDSRLLICPERFPGSNPGGCAIEDEMIYSSTVAWESHDDSIENEEHQ